MPGPHALVLCEREKAVRIHARPDLPPSDVQFRDLVDQERLFRVMERVQEESHFVWIVRTGDIASHVYCSAVVDVLFCQGAHDTQIPSHMLRALVVARS